MTLAHHYRRLRLRVLIFVGKASVADFLALELKMAFEKLTEIVAQGSAAADAIIAQAASDATALAAANSAAADADTTASGIVQPLVDKLTAAEPPAPQQ